MKKCIQYIIWLAALCTCITTTKSQDLTGHTNLPDLEWKFLDYSDGIPAKSFFEDIVQDKAGNIWISTNKGLYQYNGYEVNAFHHNLKDTNSIIEEYLGSMRLDNAGKILSGGVSRGFMLFDPSYKSSQWILNQNHDPANAPSRIWDFYFDTTMPLENQKIWVSAENGLHKYDWKNKTYKRFNYKNEALEKKHLEYLNTGRRILADPLDTDHIYWCTRAGLFSFDTVEETFEYLPSPFNSHSVSFIQNANYLIITAQFVDSFNLWCGTWDGGLQHFNTQTRTWSQYRIADVPHRNDVDIEIAKKSNHELWVSTTAGFGVFDTETHTFEFFKPDDKDPLTYTPQYQSRHFLFTRDSVLFVLGTTGVNYSHTLQIKSPAAHKHEIELTSLKINGKYFDEDTVISRKNYFFLEEQENNVEFTMTLPYFGDLSDVNYQYWLEGVDQQWQNNESKREIYYSHLKGGKYRLKYRARINEQPWIYGHINPIVEIHKPIWKKAWFLCSVLGLIAACIYFIYMNRVQRIKKEEAMRTDFNKKLAEVKMSALRAQMNPHFMFNSLNSIKTYILKEKTQEASMYLTKFSQLMRAVLRNSKSELVPLMDEIKALKLYVELEALRFEDEFDYKICVQDEIKNHPILIPPLLIQPYVENAIRHGLLEKNDGQRNLWVRVKEMKDDKLKIEIEDNGIGRQASQKNKRKETKHKSYGMEITKDRIELIKEKLNFQADIHVEDLPNDTGTRVVITIPKLTTMNIEESD